MYDKLWNHGRMTEPLGRREASKQATRAALAAAAKRLFAERGFEETTVRDIAAAANVTERTFYRYFDGKEGLLAGEFQSWLDILRTGIIARPAGEPSFTAVQRALMSLSQRAADGSGPVPPMWLFGEGTSLRSLRRAAPRPLLRIESTICDAILARIGADADGADPDEQFRAQVIARVAVGALRSAIIRHRQLAGTGQAGQPGAGRRPAENTVEQLLARAFAIIGDADRKAHRSGR
jgi:AcrR family transcriptional regulator